MMKKCLLLFFIRISTQCEVPTFKNNVIHVNGENQSITGCISPATIRLVGTDIKIVVKNQDIQDLNYGAVRGIFGLSHFDLFNNNKLQSIRVGALLDLPLLRYIRFKENKILMMISENVFQDLPSLFSVELSNNKISSLLPRSFNNLPILSQVSLSGNELENFDQFWFYKTPGITELNLGRNRLRKIPRGAFNNLPSIQRLLLEDNEIEVVDKDAFRGLINLVLLDLNENKLKSVNFNFYAPTTFKGFIISNNNVTYVSEEMLNVIKPSLWYLVIDYNPLQCACLEKILQWSYAFNITVPQHSVPQSGAVCVIPKRKPDQCFERSDGDLQEGFWVNFEDPHRNDRDYYQ